MIYVALIIIISSLLSSCSTSTSTSTGEVRGGDSNYILSWTIPDKRSDGSDFLSNDIFGYEACYSFNEGAEICETFEIIDPSQNTYDLPEMEPGTYRFTLAVIDSENIYSDRSEILEYTVN